MTGGCSSPEAAATPTGGLRFTRLPIFKGPMRSADSFTANDKQREDIYDVLPRISISNCLYRHMVSTRCSSTAISARLIEAVGLSLPSSPLIRPERTKAATAFAA